MENNNLQNQVISVLDDDITQIYKNYDPTKNKSSNTMTKYEKALIIGQRAEQLSNGAEPLIKVPDGIYDFRTIARLELTEKAIPFIVKRPVGNSFEYFKIEDLEVRE